ncbi:LysR family transcriptional regulator [Amycolatopsis alkalitolerans]|uniref:LysR family transcriptional regulator n=1 Tax=Amycolatopsis alkalitolerans TaxID=2547244 RepID=A0A5C4LTE7_9PSEU|nr:LysR family transcriptional regulator [Amycolatopsis alkalitolerans]TNC21517.1 LysR family transcriptional regulator [Amycolatopsis alkalitolerans]
MLDVHRLRLLRELSRHGTIAATARVCSLTPSAVSQQLSLLEKDVRTPLFIRDGRRLILTQAAEVLVEHAEEVLAALERASAGVAALTATVRGVLRIAAFPTAARALVPGAIARCRAEHPDLRVQLTERSVTEAITDLKAGHVDLALIYEYNLLPAVRDPGVESDLLVREPLLAALPATLPVPGGPLRLDVLAGQPWIAAASDDELRKMLERACGLAGFAPRLDFTSSDYTVIFALVEAGLGVSLVPRLALESMSTDIQLRPVAEPDLDRTVSVAVRAGSRRHPPIAAFLSALHDVAEGIQ